MFTANAVDQWKAIVMPVLETARLRLRPFRLEDAPEQHQLVYSDTDVMRYVADGTTRTSTSADSPSSATAMGCSGSFGPTDAR